MNTDNPVLSPRVPAWVFVLTVLWLWEWGLVKTFRVDYLERRIEALEAKK